MRPAGLAAVEAAQADGRWERAYAGPATITCPTTSPRRWPPSRPRGRSSTRWTGQNRYAVLHRVHTAATPATRAKRIAAAVQMLADGHRIH